MSEEEVDIALPTIPEALRFRMDQYGWNQTKLAEELGLQRSHMSEILNGKRPITFRAARAAYRIGVPAAVLLQE